MWYIYELQNNNLALQYSISNQVSDLKNAIDNLELKTQDLRTVNANVQTGNNYLVGAVSVVCFVGLMIFFFGGNSSNANFSELSGQVSNLALEHNNLLGNVAKELHKVITCLSDVSTKQILAGNARVFSQFKLVQAMIKLQNRNIKGQVTDCDSS